MAVVKAQSTTGNGATVVLNGCVAGNALIYQCSWFRSVGTGVAEATPADSNGTFSISRADTPASFGAGNDVGVSIFHQQNINAGTHTVTPQANPEHHVSLCEFSGLSTTGLFVAGSANSAKINETAGLVSQLTGTTSTAAAVGDLAVIDVCVAGNPGSASMGFTDPVAGYTTLQLSNDDASSIGVSHGFQVLASGGTKSATFNWSDSGSSRSAHAAIATFAAASGGATTGPQIMGRMIMVNK